MEFYVNITSIAIVSHISSFYEACTTEGFGNTKKWHKTLNSYMNYISYAEERQARQMIMRRRSTEQLKRSHLKTDQCKIER